MPPDPGNVPAVLVREPRQLDALAAAISDAAQVAIDTEVPIDGPAKGRLRVASIATRSHDGTELAFVVDARDIDPTRLAPLLDGVTADAWNATFDARVLDEAVWKTDDVTHALDWWDAQLGDALLHQGMSGVSWFHGLAWATNHYLGIDAAGKGTIQLSYTATDDLTEPQVRYAANDAVETLWVAAVIRAEVAAAGLETVCQLEMAARPFLDRMERAGLPFDWDSWRVELDRLQSEQRLVLTRIAELTGGGQGSLFDDATEPSWNPASDKQVRDALNRWSPAEVRAYTARTSGEARGLDDDDRVSAGVLRSIGGPLSDAVLAHRRAAKILGTYGESIHEHLAANGRMHPQYLQVVGTNTGRLASRNPNAQNFTPQMLPHVRPHDPHRVFVHADLSQAELRCLAHVADDSALRAAFARGDDVHESTAATMFAVDPERLRRDDPARLKELRHKAKALNFGIAYGTGARSLAQSLTANGTPTTFEEGQRLLHRYRCTYPGTTEWADARIAEIEVIARRTSRIDWPQTMRLARRFGAVDAYRRGFRRDHQRWPTAHEVAVGLQTDEQSEIAWVMRFSAPVALVDDATPFTFASRTIAGRRQQFNLHLDRLFLHAAIHAAQASSPALVATRRRFEQTHGVALQHRGRALSDKALERVFEPRSLRREYIDAITITAGETVAHELLHRSARARVAAMVNAWRNAPIQGSVADIMLDGFARLHQLLRAHPSARPVQTVHDSVVVECEQIDAPAIAGLVEQSLVEASRRFCPSITPRVDVDVRRSLADDSVLRA